MKKITGDDIALRSIGKKHLNFDITNPGVSNGSFQNFSISNYDEFTSGESLLIHALFIDDEGLAYNADNTNDKPAIGIGRNEVTTGGKVRIQYSGEIQIPNAVFELNKPVYLSVMDGSVPNLSTDVPVTTSGYIAQIVGRSLGASVGATTDKMIINIAEIEYFE